ncbi:MAG: DUF3048 domain-containing protein, partial [Erysipelotrichales bacterium]
PKAEITGISAVEPIVYLSASKATTTSIFTGKTVYGNTYEAVGVMFENTGAARPQSGISLADVVYEIAVDTWQISRFLGIFSSTFPTKVGPVRSARFPFVRVIREWGIAFTHFGAGQTGLGNVLPLIRATKFPVRFDGHTGLNDQFFSRDPARKAPHNAYWNAYDALELIPEIEVARHFLFDKNTYYNAKQITTLNLKYASTNRVTYTYLPEEHRYARFINEEPMMDAYNDQQVKVTNIIIQHAPHYAVEKVNYIIVEFEGSGAAEYFIDGAYIKGTWKKPVEGKPTQFFDDKGVEIKLLPGNTWIQVVHPKIPITMN